MPPEYEKDQKENVKAHILDSGYECIRRYGIKKTTIHSVVRNVGLSTGSFYAFFQTKDQLITEVYQRELYRTQYNLIRFSRRLLTDGKVESFLDDLMQLDFSLRDSVDNEDLAYLKSRCGQVYENLKNQKYSIAETVYGVLRNQVDRKDVFQVINLMQIYQMIRRNQELFAEEMFEETVLLYKKMIYRYFRSKYTV